ncbi:NAD(P)-dependent oxidoreductase [Candidatus Daviesbacteria bacterium]|nr:NAD(P)-dependent oxidoreductase [Candidatus Daviesbacteria bacterium]
MNKVLLIGGTGLVGSRIIQLLDKKFEFIAPSHEQLDVLNPELVLQAVENIKPSSVLYAAGFTNVDLAEGKEQECFALNSKAPGYFVEATKKAKIPFYYLSTDYVFDGEKSDAPYTEDDLPNPLDQVYAKSKYEGEQVVLGASPINSVLRIIVPFSAVFTKKLDLARLFVSKLKNNEKISGIYNQKINPVFVDDLVAALGKILEARASGIYHIAATDFTTPYGYAKTVARVFGFDEGLIEKVDYEDYVKTRRAKRPQDTWLDTHKFRKEFGEGILHTVEEEIEAFKSQFIPK